jgi:hypothetical protein
MTYLEQEAPPEPRVKAPCTVEKKPVISSHRSHLYDVVLRTHFSCRATCAKGEVDSGSQRGELTLYPDSRIDRPGWGDGVP